jgi:LysM repeat protein
MGTQRMRILVLVVSLLFALGAAACTRSASTPFPGDSDAAPAMQSSDTQATMDAVRSAILTQTAQVSEGEGDTATPEPDETEAAETEAAMEETATATPTTTPEGGITEYTVKSGDWIFKIARQFGVDPQEIIDLNNLTNPSNLEPGMVLDIPSAGAPPATEEVETGTPGTPRTPGTVHIVKQGEWIWQIARNYGVDPQAIIDANNLSDPTYIYPGQELIIP